MTETEGRRECPMIDSPSAPHPSPLPNGEREKKDGRLAENIVHFARALRAAGLPVGPGAVLDALEAVNAAGVGTKDDFYWTLHAVFVKRHEHSLIFEQAFRIFFRKRGFLDQLMAMMLPQAPGAPPEAPPRPASRRRCSPVSTSSSSRRSARSRSTPPSRCPTASSCRRRILLR